MLADGGFDEIVIATGIARAGPICPASIIPRPCATST
jgi:hypothetical protein